MTALSRWLCKVSSFGAKRCRWRLVPASWLTVCLLWLTLAPLAPGFGTVQAAAATVPLPLAATSDSINATSQKKQPQQQEQQQQGTSGWLSKLLAEATGQPGGQAGTLLTNNNKPTSSTAQNQKALAAKPVTRRPTDPQAEAKWFYGQRAQPGATIPKGALERSLKQSQANQPAPGAAGSQLGPKVGAPAWTSIGPAPAQVDPSKVDTIGPFGYVSGRVSSLAYDNGTATLYAGTAGGGIWKHTMAGSADSWTPLSDNQPSLVIGAVALDTSTTPLTIYAGTGEANYYLDSYYSTGILKSSDGGANWTPLAQDKFGSNRTSGGYHIGKLVVDPQNAQHLLVATDNGLWLSTDSGATFSQPLGSGVNVAAITDVVVDSSTTPSTVYAAWGYYNGSSFNGVYKSTDGGASFTKLANAPGGSSFGRIALTQASDHSRLYLTAANPALGQFGASLGVWSSLDGGTTWSQPASAYTGAPDSGPDLFGDDINSGSERGTYSMVLAVDPASPLTIYAGGINLFKSIDGGQTFSDVTNVYTTSNPTPHADQHALVFYGNNSFYLGNDGGVYSTADGATNWSDNNPGLAITQFYAASTPTANLSTATSPLIWGGTQGNGTQEYTGSAIWNQLLDGSGGFTAVDPTDSNTVWAEQSGLHIYKTTDGGANWNLSTSGIGDTDNRLYIAPFVLDPASAAPNQRLLAGTNYLYESTDGGDSWHPIGNQSLAADASQPFGAISAIALASDNRTPAKNNIIYAGTGDGKLWVIDLGLANPQWASIDVSGVSGRFVTALAVNPTDYRDVVVAFSGFANATGSGTGTHLYRSTNAGTSWTDISAPLPDSPVNSVLRNPTSPNSLYVGTDTGFYYTNNGGTSWTQYQTGLPNVAIDQLFTDSSFTTLLAATHGRSMFKLATSALPTAPPALSVTPTSLIYSATAGGANPADQTVMLSAANGTITWAVNTTYSANSGSTNWLTVTPNAGSLVPGNPSSITLHATTGSLAPDSYTATVTFQDQDPNNSADKAVVNVTFTISAGSPTQIVVVSGSPQSAPVTQAFAQPLKAKVTDSFNNPLSNVSVTFQAPSGLGNASGTFAGGSLTATATTDATGVATSPVFSASTIAGSYTVTAGVSGVATPASFNLTNTAGAASAITVVAGTPQSATVNTAFATALKAKVTDSYNNPVAGVTVQFQAPNSGASGNFTGGTAGGVSVTTGSDGMATAPVFTANTIAGSYAVAASASGVTGPASFSLTNTAGSPASIVAIAGTPQSATVNTAFATGLQALVKDSYNNAVGGANVQFQAPASGASGTFSGATSNATITTDSSGLATAPTFTANTTAGSYTVNATVVGYAGAGSANFSLTNLSACSALVVSLNTDDGSGTTCGTLSYAIIQANSATQPATISFTTNQVSLSGTLPTIGNVNGVAVTVEGGCTIQAGGQGAPGVRLVAATGAGVTGITLRNRVTVDGLSITGFSGYAIDIRNFNNQVTCNWLGTSDGVTAAPNGGGIQLGHPGGVGSGGSIASNNFIGVANKPESGNLISGNSGTGIQVTAGSDNEAHFNLVNLQKDGTTPLTNGGPGINTEVDGQLYFADDNIVGY